MKDRFLSGSVLLAALSLAVPGAFFAQQPPPPVSESAGARINVNTASEAQLLTLPGIDELAAKRIIAGRPYSNMMQFLRAARLPLTQAQALQPHIVLSDEPPPPELPSSPPPKTKPQPPAQRPASGAQSKQATAEYSGPTTSGAAPRLEKINVNRASLRQLATLPGVDELIARKIIAGRPYKNASQFFQTIKLPPLDVQRLESRILF